MLEAIAYSRRHLSPWASQYQVCVSIPCQTMSPRLLNMGMMTLRLACGAYFFYGLHLLMWAERWWAMWACKAGSIVCTQLSAKQGMPPFAGGPAARAGSAGVQGGHSVRAVRSAVRRGGLARLRGALLQGPVPPPQHAAPVPADCAPAGDPLVAEPHAAHASSRMCILLPQRAADGCRSCCRHG